MDKPDFNELAKAFSTEYWTSDRTTYELHKKWMDKFYDDHVTPLQSRIVELEKDNQQLKDAYHGIMGVKDTTCQ